MKKMKKSMITAGLALAVMMMGFTSCDKSDDPAVNEIEGIYIGSFSVSASLKSTPFGGLDDHHDTAVVSKMGEMQFELHCFGEEIDTTIILAYYNHNDSVMVCLTGDDFQHMYGHMLGHGHMSGGMMGDKGQGESEWMHHLDDEHIPGDEHFGGFGMEDRSFTYSFKMMNESTPYYLKFHGVKQ